MVIFQYNLYIFGIHLRTVLYSKPCYNEPCYKEVEVYSAAKFFVTQLIPVVETVNIYSKQVEFNVNI